MSRLRWPDSTNSPSGIPGTIQAGIDALLGKPVTPADLFACVAKVTGRLNVFIPPESEEAASSEGLELLTGARVLLAEDHPVNRQVATTMLETLKCNVDVFVDGAQAVAAVQRERYDLIFLDCQMPKLDGYEAAREIRRLEKEGNLGGEGEAGRSGRLPIVALTAHTAPADRARSFESGMDEFVTKPFTLQTLRDVLRTRLNGRIETEALPPSPASATPRSHATDDAPISEAVLEQIFELDRLNGGGVFETFATTFLEAMPITLAALWTAVREEDAVGVARAAHAVKGATRNLGAQLMAELSQELEALGKSGTTEGAAALATKLDALYAEVKTVLEARLEKARRDDAVSV